MTVVRTTVNATTDIVEYKPRVSKLEENIT
jgi:hypothetical protein